MIKIGLRDARAHFRRFIMSIIAIALGVAFVIGSFCFRAMLDNQISDMMASNSDADVYVRGSVKQESNDDEQTNQESNSDTFNLISPNVIDDITNVTGVDNASVGYSTSNAVLVDKDGNAVGSVGPPTIAIGVSDQAPWRSCHMEQGHWPSNDNEIALLNDSAQQAHLTVGDSTTVVLPDGPRTMKVVGIFSATSSQAGATIIAITPQLAKQFYEKESGTSNVNYIGVYGSMKTPLTQEEQQTLADRINKALPASADAKAVTGNQVRDDITKTTQEQLGFIQPLILIFALIALFVGSFIIANTFTMIVRDSMRGYALLRSVGASSLQVFVSVIVQAIVLGIIGSILGILLGWGMLELISSGMSHMGYPISGSPTPTISDITIGIVVGIVVSVLGASIPAKSAALAPPIQAMNETVNPEKPIKLRACLGSAMVLLGAASWWLTYAKANHDAILPDMSIGWPLGIGAALIVIGTIVLAPGLVAPAQGILGFIPSHLFKVTGRLATRNIARAKRRTANTAAALFVGVAIVSTLGIIASSAKASVSDLIDTGMKADFALTSANMSQGIPQKAAQEIEQVQGVESVAAIRVVFNVKYDNESGNTCAIQKSLLQTIFPPKDYQGNPVASLQQGELLVGTEVADKYHYKIGQSIEVSGIKVISKPTGNPEQPVSVEQEKTQKTLKIGAIIGDSVYQDSYFMSEDTMHEITDDAMSGITQMFVLAKPDTNLTTLRERLEKTVRPYYTIAVMDRDEFKSTMSSMINQMLAIIYALLALSIVIAIFGIVNTLALSVSERTREIGLLRAIGTSKGQIRGMLGIEAVIIAVFGTLLGIIVGLFAGVVIQAAYKANGLTTLDIPWGQLGIFLVLSIVVGLIASISPANKALKQPVLDAVSSE